MRSTEETFLAFLLESIRNTNAVNVQESLVQRYTEMLLGSMEGRETSYSAYSAYKKAFLPNLLLETSESLLRSRIVNPSEERFEIIMHPQSPGSCNLIEFSCNSSGPFIWDVLEICCPSVSNTKLNAIVISRSKNLLDFKAFVLEQDKKANHFASSNASASPEAVAVKFTNLVTPIRILHSISARTKEPIIFSCIEGPLLIPIVPNYLTSQSLVSHLARQLNESQLNTVRHLLTFSPYQRVNLVHGPPGTGKTKTTAIMVAGALEMGKNVMFTAPSNGAVVNGARAFIKAIKTSSDSNAVQESMLSNMVIVGDNVRLGIEKKDDLYPFILESKVELTRLIISAWTAAVSAFESVWESGSTLSFQEFQCQFIDCWKSLVEHWEQISRIWTVYLPSSLFLSNVICLLPNSWINLKKDTEKFMEYFSDFSKPYISRTSYFLDLLKSRTVLNSMLSYLDEIIEKIRILNRNIQTLTDPIRSTSSLPSKIISHSKLCFSTVSVSGRMTISSFASEIKGEIVAFVDEAGQLIEAETLILIDRSNPISSLVLIGDEKQLPSVVFSQKAKDSGYGQSLLEKMKVKGVFCNLLNIQYRMNPVIAGWSSNEFYERKLIDSPHLINRDCIISDLEVPQEDSDFGGPLFMLDLPDGTEVRDLQTGSLSNELEACVIIRLLKRLVDNLKESNYQGIFSVGIITFYSSQKSLIVQKLDKYGAKGRTVFVKGNLHVSVNTVDAFQGQEKDLIILSTVRSNIQRKIGFTSSPNRLNVACTRAKHGLWIIADISTFSMDPFWKSLIQYCRKNGIVKAAKNGPFEGLQKEILLSRISVPVVGSQPPMVVCDYVWNVLFTKQSKNAIEKLEPRLITNFVDQIERLASGISKSKIGVESQKHSVFFFNIEKKCAIWSIELESLGPSYLQAIQIWDVCEISVATKSVNHVRHILESRSTVYKEACAIRTFEDINNKRVLVPASIPKEDGSIVFYKGRHEEQLDDIGLEVAEDLTNYVKLYKMTRDNLEEEKELVENADSLFILGRSGTGKTTVMLSRILLKEISAHKAGLGNEQTQWLITCNNKLKSSSESYYEKMRLGFPFLVDLKMPVFYSLDEVLELIENRFENRFFSKYQDEGSFALDIGDSSLELLVDESEIAGLIQRSNKVSFERFDTSFYPRFSSSVTKRFSASMLWTEFNSVIKGSISLLSNSRNYLSKSEYLDVANARISVLSVEDRGIIYDCWRQYESSKAKNGAYDTSDLTLHVYRQLESANSEDKFSVDYIYLDEVQDMTQIQIALFKFICQNKSGFVFGGDTAQTIAQGVGFRFQDVRFLFYEHFLLRSTEHLPRLWQLKQNYRTHSGILALSNTLIEKVFEFFPNTVDKVESETGALFQGARPWYIEDSSDGIAKVLFGSDAEEEKDLALVEMGSNQAIIVRHEAVKAELQMKIPGALILTIFESKGMEFEDVLLYNFFRDSNCSYSKWRLLVSESKTYHGFDEKRDYDLCTELKALYVGVTRAKCQLVIIDESENVNPILDWWRKDGVISFISPGDRSLSFAKASSLESWNERGEEFLERFQYESAIICFTRGKNSRQLSRSQALFDVQNGERLTAAKKFADGRIHFLHAAELFIQIDEGVRAAECFLKGKQFQKAADLLFASGFLIKALAICLETRALQPALDFLKQSSKTEEVEAVNKYARFFALAARRKADRGLVTEFLTFVPVSSARQFLKRYKEFDLLFQYDVKMENYAFCAESSLLKKKYAESFFYFLKDSQKANALRIWVIYFLRPRVAFRYFEFGESYKSRSEIEFQKVWDAGSKIMNDVSVLFDYSAECHALFDILSGSALLVSAPPHIRCIVEESELVGAKSRFEELHSTKREDKEEKMKRMKSWLEKGTSVLNKLTSSISTLRSIRSLSSSESVSGFASMFPFSVNSDQLLEIPGYFIDECKMDGKWKNGISWNSFSMFVQSLISQRQNAIFQEIAISLFYSKPTFLMSLGVCVSKSVGSATGAGGMQMPVESFFGGIYRFLRGDSRTSTSVYCFSKLRQQNSRICRNVG